MRRVRHSSRFTGGHAPLGGHAPSRSHARMHACKQVDQCLQQCLHPCTQPCAAAAASSAMIAPNAFCLLSALLERRGVHAITFTPKTQGQSHLRGKWLRKGQKGARSGSGARSLMIPARLRPHSHWHRLRHTLHGRAQKCWWLMRHHRGKCHCPRCQKDRPLHHDRQCLSHQGLAVVAVAVWVYPGAGSCPKKLTRLSSSGHVERGVTFSETSPWARRIASWYVHTAAVREIRQ
mmetsp:Transcript_45148/g.118467  ORF Transcript_45148/g.118467 Transcript_45148/m.118467 type:complete len:234 (-) Transcript_45148:274-975(-)